MSAKRNPQTAAKRAREQALREKRERKAAKKQAAILARNEPAAADASPATSFEGDESPAGEAPAGDTHDAASVSTGIAGAAVAR